MRKSARNRIIIWSIVSVVLIGMLSVGIHVFSKYSIYNNLEFIKNEIRFLETDTDYYTSAGESIVFSAAQADSIDSIDIDWIAGDVEVVRGDTNEISIEETSSYEITEENAMRYSLDGSTLKITAGKDYAFFNLFSFGSSGLNKNLTVTIPKDKSLDALDIDAASADINIDGAAEINEVRADTASGCIGIYNVTGEKAEVNTASGNIVIDSKFESINTENISGQTEITANCKKLDMSSVSGEVNATVGKETASIDAESVSSNINVTLPKSIAGFTADYETVSGKFSSDFEGKSYDGKFVNGDGTLKIDLQTVSGNITITQS